MSRTFHSPIRLLLCVPGRAPGTSLTAEVVIGRATVLYALSTRQVMICCWWSLLRAKPLFACSQWLWLQECRELCIPTKRTTTWNEELGFSWFTQVFQSHCGPQRPQLLLLNGHISHEFVGLLEAAKTDNGISTSHNISPLTARSVRLWANEKDI